MKVSIGSDHKGYAIKNSIIEYLNSQAIDVYDFGTWSEEAVDYPDFALPACEQVIKGQVDYAILVCYTGIGMSMAANKIPGIRASLIVSEENAILTRAHNDANCLCLSAKDLGIDDACRIVSCFINTSFEGGRHLNRVNKLKAIEDKYEKKQIN